MGKDRQHGTIRLTSIYISWATTRAGALSAPLRDRFGVLSRLEYYTVDQLSEIVERTAEVFEVEIDSLLEIARRARGTPRIVFDVRDFAQFVVTERLQWKSHKWR